MFSEWFSMNCGPPETKPTVFRGKERDVTKQETAWFSSEPLTERTLREMAEFVRDLRLPPDAGKHGEVLHAAVKGDMALLLAEVRRLRSLNDAYRNAAVNQLLCASRNHTADAERGIRTGDVNLFTAEVLKGQAEMLQKLLG